MKIFRFDKNATISKDIAIAKFSHFYDGIPFGEYLTTIEKVKKHRSYPQNRLMWLLFTALEVDSDTGSSRQDFHDYYCGKFLTRKIFINGIEKDVVSGTSKLNTVEFKDFLDRIYADVIIEFCISLPHPEDVYFAEFEKTYEKYL